MGRQQANRPARVLGERPTEPIDLCELALALANKRRWKPLPPPPVALKAKEAPRKGGTRKTGETFGGQTGE